MSEIKSLTAVTSKPVVLDGKKVPVKDVIGRQLVFTGWNIGPSKFKDRDGNNKQCLTLQFEDGLSHKIVQTSSTVLIAQIKEFEAAAPADDKFQATIQMHDDYLVFE